MFEGLYTYEGILLILGVVMFIALLVVLFIKVLRKESFTGLLTFFFFPILMIGFPGIQTISYENGKLILEKKERYVKEHPDDDEARKEYADAIEKVEQRAGNSEEAKVLVAKGYAALGNYEKAFDQVTLVASNKKSSAKTRTALQTIGAEIINASVSDDAVTSLDPSAKLLVAKVTNVLENEDSLTPESQATLVKANIALGRIDEANKYATRVKQLSPAIQLSPKIKAALRTAQP